MTGPQRTTRCVVLQAPGEALDAAVAASLTRRGWRLTTLDNPYMAMVELCLLERAETTRCAWGPNQPAPKTLK